MKICSASASRILGFFFSNPVQGWSVWVFHTPNSKEPSLHPGLWSHRLCGRRAVAVMGRLTFNPWSLQDVRETWHRTKPKPSCSLLCGTSSGFEWESLRHSSAVVAQTQLRILRVETRSRIFGKLGSRNEHKCLYVLLIFVCGFHGYNILPGPRRRVGGRSNHHFPPFGKHILYVS